MYVQASLLALGIALGLAGLLGAAPSGGACGGGLSAEYFAAGDWRGPALQRVEPRLALAGTVPGLPPGPLSARYQGWLVAPRAGAYTLTLEGVGQARLSLGGQAVEGALPLHLQARLGSAPVELRVEYRTPEAQARLRLDWEGPGQPREAVPPTALRPLAAEGTGLRAAGVGSQALGRGVELLWNPGFEQGTAAWVELAGGSFTATAPGRTGSLAAATQQWVYAAQTLPYAYVQVGPTYTLEGWARSPQGAACVIGVKGGDASAITFDYPLTFTGADWQLQSRSFTLPAGTLWAEVYVQAQAGPTQGCAFDDLSLFAGARSPLAPAPGLQDNRLQNPGFEQGLAQWNLATGSAQTPAGGLSGQMLAYQAWSWVYQIVPLAGLAPGQRLVLKGWVQNPANQACTLGLQGGNETAITFDAPFHYRALDWTEVYTEVSLPPGTTWLGAYLAGPTGCRFDELALGVPDDSTNQEPVITLGAPVVGVEGAALFDASGTEGDTVSFSWDFGDGTTGNGAVVSHTYQSPGRYTITLRATDAQGGIRQSQTTLQVLPSLKQMLEQPTNHNSFSLTLDAGEPLPGLSYTWSLGDGREASGSRITHTYAAVGTYNLTLTVRDTGGPGPQGVRAQSTGRIVHQQRFWHTVWRKKPVARFTLHTPRGAGIPVGNPPLTVSFDAGASTDPNPDGTGLTFTWAFGDGAISTGPQVSHTYTQPGVYLVTLTATNRFGLHDQARTFVHVRDIRSNATLNIQYPTLLSGQGLSEAPGDRLRTASLGGVRPQNVDVVQEVYPYVLFSTNDLRTGVFRPLRPDGSFATTLCNSFAAYLNGSPRPVLINEVPGTDGLVCDFMTWTPGTFGRLPVRAINTLLITSSQYFADTTLQVIGGLRVPKVYILVVPDRLLPGDQAGPVFSEYTATDPASGRNELMLVVRVRQGELENGQLSFPVPVYAVDDQGRFMSGVNGFFRARFASTQVQSDCGDCIMVNGRATLNVRLSPPSFVPGSNRLDLSTLTLWGGNPSCGVDSSPFSNAFKHRLSGCATVTASPEAPSANAPANIPPYPYALDEVLRTRFGHVVFGETAEKVRAWDAYLTNGIYEDFKDFVLPGYANGKACLEMLDSYQERTSTPNLQSLTVTALACVGTALELAPGGAVAAQGVKNLAKVYRASKAADGPLSKALEDEVRRNLRTAQSAEEMRAALEGSFKNLAQLHERCGKSCLDEAEAFAQAQIAAGRPRQVAIQRADDLARACSSAGVSPQGAIRFDPCNLGLPPSAIATGYANTADGILRGLPEEYLLANGQMVNLRKVTIAVAKNLQAQLVVTVGGRLAPEAITWLKANTNWNVLDIKPITNEPFFLPNGSTNSVYHAERQMFREGIEQMGISRQMGLCQYCTEFFKQYPQVEIAVFKP